MLGQDMDRSLHLRPILFDHNDATVRADASGELTILARKMKLKPSIRLELVSHMDGRGIGGFDQFLSMHRAESTKAYLVATCIAPTKIYTRGIGERLLVNLCGRLVTCPREEH